MALTALSLDQALAAYRAEADQRRSGAFTDCPEYVLGIPVRPITPATWTLLGATGSAFVAGRIAQEGDIRNFLWFHSPLFTTHRLFSGPRRWLAHLRFNAILHRRRDLGYYAGHLAMAGADIDRIIVDTFADVAAPNHTGRSVAPGACLEAQLEHFFRQHYGWPAARTRHTPLRRLFQYMRCISPGEDVGEQAIKVAYLRSRNAALQAEPAS